MALHRLPIGWEHLEHLTEGSYWEQLERQVLTRRLLTDVYPPIEKVFTALEVCPEREVKVVILGQDPYHGYGQADGLAFSFTGSGPLPPSLRNIYKELVDDIACAPPASGDLAHWADQGVLLLNTVLTVDEGAARSHRKFGWEQFTAGLVKHLAERDNPTVFVLWGNDAKSNMPAIKAGNNNAVVTSAHPSPLSAHRGFFGSKPFSKINGHLENFGLSPINWV